LGYKVNHSLFPSKSKLDHLMIEFYLEKKIISILKDLLTTIIQIFLLKKKLLTKT